MTPTLSVKTFALGKNSVLISLARDMDMTNSGANGVVVYDHATEKFKIVSNENFRDYVLSEIGFTPENTANKAVSFTTINDLLYPTVQAVKTQLDLKVPSAAIGYNEITLSENETTISLNGFRFLSSKINIVGAGRTINVFLSGTEAIDGSRLFLDCAIPDVPDFVINFIVGETIIDTLVADDSGDSAHFEFVFVDGWFTKSCSVYPS
jgi:hypothetical protein